MTTRPPAQPCPGCGFAQASHWSLWLSNTGDVITLKLPTRGVPFYDPLSRAGEIAASLLGRTVFSLGRLLGVISLSSDPGTATSRRSRLLWSEALRRGLRMEQLLFLGRATDTFRVRSGKRSEFFKSLPLAPFGDALRMDDKVLFKEAMTAARLPVPRSSGVLTFEGALRALEEFEIVCVKPRAGSNGRHTYPYVRTKEELRKALRSAKQVCAFASVEEHLEGNLCRATCVGGSLVGFLESEYPSVKGDGMSTVGELIIRANAKKPEGVADIVVDDSHQGYISRRGYALDSVLPKGISLPLTYRAGSSMGGGNREHGRAIHPSFIEPIEEAARLTGLSIVGFDLIVPDPTKPADEQRWGFIEANSLPWIDLHAAPLHGAPIDLAPSVWELWEAQGPVRDTR